MLFKWGCGLMWVPENWIALYDAGKELRRSVHYDDPEDWVADLWESVSKMSEVRALMPDFGVIKNPDNGIRIDPLYAKWEAGHFSLCDNGHIDVCGGIVIAGTAKGLPIILPEREWKAFLNGLVKGNYSKGGRRPHLAKTWYENQDCERNGRSIKQLQREMQNHFGGKPPSETTIRTWEKEFGN
jgi:hypothetical protein